MAVKSSTLAFSIAGFALLAACATQSRVESQLIGVGVSPKRAACVADGLQEDLSGQDLNDVSAFLDDLSRAQTAGGALDALLGIDNPRIAAAMAKASVTCAFK